MKNKLTMMLGLLLILVTMGSQTSFSAPQWPSKPAAPQTFTGTIPAAPAHIVPAAPIGFALDDGVPENASGFGNSTYNISAAAIWLNGYSVPASVPYPLTLTGIQIDFPGFSAGDFVGDQIQLLIYLDTDRDGNPSNAPLIYQAQSTITTADWYTFQYFPVNNLVVNTRGDLYVGWEDKWAEGGPSPREYIAATDNTNPQHRSWIFANTHCCTPNIFNLSSNDYKHRIDDFNPGNLMIRLLADSNTPATATPVPTNTPTATSTPLPPRCPGERFTDVCPGDYFYQPVLDLNDAGIVAGYNTSPPCLTQAHVPCYLPYSNVTRGQSAKIVSSAAGFTEPVSGQLFEDIPPGSTFYEYVQRLADRGIVAGYPCGGAGEPCGPNNLPYFRQNNSVTRGQLSKMTAEAFGYQDEISGQAFEDVQVSSTFYLYVQRLAERGLINGYACGSAGEPCGPSNLPYFRPANAITRGQTAKILYLARSMVTPTPTITPTFVPTFTPTPTYTPAATNTDTPVPTTTLAGTMTMAPTDTSIPTSTETQMPTMTATVTATATTLRNSTR